MTARYRPTNGARFYREPGIFVAFEGSSRHIVAKRRRSAGISRSWVSNRLFFLDAYLSPQILHAGSFDLAGILAATEQEGVSESAP